MMERSGTRGRWRWHSLVDAPGATTVLTFRWRKPGLSVFPHSGREGAGLPSGRGCRRLGGACTHAYS